MPAIVTGQIERTQSVSPRSPAQLFLLTALIQFKYKVALLVIEIYY